MTSSRVGGVLMATALLASGPLMGLSQLAAFGGMAVLAAAALVVALTLKRGIQPQSAAGATSEP